MCEFHLDGTRPYSGKIFVFGANEAGVHGAGAAKAAYDYYGAIYGVGEGIQGCSYGIPTKDKNIERLSLTEIKKYVDRFKEYVINNPEKSFFVTRVGCFLAGYKDEDISPMFRDIPRCSFAYDWELFLTNSNCDKA